MQYPCNYECRKFYFVKRKKMQRHLKILILKLLKDTNHLGFLNTFDEETSFSPDISKRLTCGHWLIRDNNNL